MPETISIADQNELINTADCPVAKFPFEQFNPVQSRVFEFYNKDCNALIAAATSAGKTVVAEMFAADEIRTRGGKAMYLSPLKALSQEKIDDWKEPEHHFQDLKLAICTGDYRLTLDRKKELAESNIILMTTEMLNSCCRNYKSEKNEFLQDIGTIVVDESHLLCVPGRGDKLEVGLLKLTEINPNIRIVFLSATMPNVKEIADWLSHLNNKDTYVLESKYRPCPLKVHYLTYNDSPWKYEAKEMEKCSVALDLVTQNFEDKFLIFAHTKRTGDMMVKLLQQFSIDCEFHNADLDKSKRIKLENKFRNDPKFRVLIATSTLAWGINAPARRVVILGVHRGMEVVPVYDIVQMQGRAGRPKYDPRGDAYVLIPRSDVGEHVGRLAQPQTIQSQLADSKGNFKVLAFHIINEIYHGTVKTKQDMFNWYDRSLAAFQNKDLKHAVVDKMIAALKATGSIKIDEDGSLQVTAIGKVASLFYFSPFDVSDINRNMQRVFENNKEMDEYWIALALANTDSNRGGIVSAAERDQIADFSKKIPFKAQQALTDNDNFSDSVKKIAYCYYSLMRGTSNPVLAGITRGVQMDYPRLAEVMFALDGMFKWEQKDYLRKLSRRISYGVDWHLVDLCSLPTIGKVKAKRLWDSNVKSLGDVVEKPHIVKIALGCSDEKLKEVTDAATRYMMGAQG